MNLKKLSEDCINKYPNRILVSNHWKPEYANAFFGIHYEYTNFNSINGLKFTIIALLSEYDAIMCYHELKKIVNGLFCIVESGCY